MHNNEQIFLREGIEWLKSRRDTLVDNLAKEMGNPNNIPDQKLPSFLRKLVAKDILQDLINRLESHLYENEVVSEKMLKALKKGAGLKHIVLSIDLMVAVVATLARQELNGQPNVRDMILKRTEYFATLLKSSLATSAMEHEKSKW